MAMDGSDPLSVYMSVCEEEGIEPNPLVASQLSCAPGSILSLDCQGLALGDSGARAVCAAALACPAIVSLDLWSNALGPASAEPLAELVASTPTLARLLLRHNDALGDAVIAAIARATHSSGGGGGGGGGLGSPGKGSSGASLEVLDVQGCGIGPAGGAALADALARPSCGLVELWVGSNPLGDGFACSLASALRRNTRLSVLDVRSSGITDRGALVLAVSLERNASLSRLYLSGNDVSPDNEALACRNARRNMARRNVAAAMGAGGDAAAIRPLLRGLDDDGPGSRRIGSSPRGSGAAVDSGPGGARRGVSPGAAASDPSGSSVGGVGDETVAAPDARPAAAGPVQINESTARGALAAALRGRYTLGLRVPAESGPRCAFPAAGVAEAGAEVEAGADPATSAAAAAGAAGGKTMEFFAACDATGDQVVVRLHAVEADFRHEEAVRHYLGDKCVPRRLDAGTAHVPAAAAVASALPHHARILRGAELHYSVCERPFEDLTAVVAGRNRVPCAARALVDRLCALAHYLAEHRVVHARLRPAAVARFADGWKFVDLRSIVFVGTPLPLTGLSPLYCAPEWAKKVLEARIAEEVDGRGSGARVAVEADVPAMLFVLGVMIAELYSPQMFLNVNAEDVLAHWAENSFRLNLRKVISDQQVAALAERLIVFDEAGRVL